MIILALDEMGYDVVKREPKQVNTDKNVEQDLNA